tara:strand:- start:626 stop:1129 length:504 start_codon:yes stop_codon:yes gene_type:complete
MDPNFNFSYDNISLEQQNAVKAVLLNLATTGDLTPEMEKSMKVRFGIEDPEMVPVEESSFWQLAKSFGGIYLSEEGFVTQIDKGRKVPSIRINADIEKLDAFLEYARINLNNREQEIIDKEEAAYDAARLEYQKTHTTSISDEEIKQKIEEAEKEKERYSKEEMDEL